MPECFNCGTQTNYVIDALLPDSDHQAFACQECGTIFKA